MDASIGSSRRGMDWRPLMAEMGLQAAEEARRYMVGWE
jgi:hypothetical protein